MKYLLALSILALIGCMNRYGSIDYPSPIDEGAVYYPNYPFPTMVMTFAPGVRHIEPADESEVHHATEMCQYYLGPGAYPLRIHKKAIREYLTVCRDPSTRG